MVTIGAIVLAVLNLILAVLEDRRASAPQRKRAEREQDYERDMAVNAQATATGDSDQLTRQFEAERQAGIGRGDLEPGPAGGGRVGGNPGGELQQLP